MQEVRREFDADGRLFFGKARLMARALGQTPAEAVPPGADRLAPFVPGALGLLLTDRAPSAVRAYFAGLARADFARAGTPATRAFAIPPGVIHSTAGEVPAEHDLPLEHTLEPELRRLGVPTRMVKGRVVLGDPDGRGQPYVVCKEGDVLDSRQTRLLKLFGVCMSEFRVRVVAHWSAATGEVTEVDPSAMEGVDED
ncbi:hypothetical protein CDD83_9689 [Cordyceps sp. RAO-2017]|nr:hypothetical protein CDD83_9689 [Cordyceps sp. RAO-2017]